MPYDLSYFKEDLQEAYDEMFRYLRESGKEGVYKDNYYLRDHLQIPYIHKNLQKPRVQEEFAVFTTSFIDSHYKQLSTSGPVHKFVFGAKEVVDLYKLFQIPNGDFLFDLYEKMIQETFYGKISKFITGWVKHAPHKMLLTSIMIEVLQDDTYERDLLDFAEYLWAFTEYPILFSNYWSIGVKEDTMNYTIEHLGNKFKIKSKKLVNLQGLLKYDANCSVLSEEAKLKTGMDHAYTDFMRRIRNQINSTMRNISNQYYENEKKNKTQHSNVTQFDDGSIVNQDGIGANLDSIIDRTVNKIATGGMNEEILRSCAEASKLEKDNLAGFINQIFADKTSQIPKMIELIITGYFRKFPTETTLTPGEFVRYGLALYRSLSNSKDDINKEIKIILDHWMIDVINIASMYGTTTQIQYTRAIFNYFIFLIIHYN